jgi:hypothetical protein
MVSGEAPQQRRELARNARDRADPLDNVLEDVKDTTGFDATVVRFDLARARGTVGRVGLADGRPSHGLTLLWKVHDLLLTGLRKRNKHLTVANRAR